MRPRTLEEASLKMTKNEMNQVELSIDGDIFGLRDHLAMKIEFGD